MSLTSERMSHTKPPQASFEMEELDQALSESETAEDLAARLKEIMSEDAPNKPTIPSNWANPKDIRADDNTLWTEVGEGGTFPQIILDLLTKSVLLPRADFQIPIAASYLMIPSAFCNRLPVLVSQGGSGTGKSTLAHLACGIHGVEPLGAGSTFPAIRNQIRNSRFRDPDAGSRGSENEKNCVLAWEDISSRSLRDFEGRIFDLIKLGVDRKGRVSMAAMGGTNITFEVFSPKLISSITPFYSEHDFRELIRRIIVIEHKAYRFFTTSDQSAIQSHIEPDDLIDLAGIDWRNCTESFNDFWFDRPNAEYYASIRRQVKKTKGSNFPTAYFDMTKDLIACGVTCGFFGSINDAIDHFAEYFEWHKYKIESQASGTEMILRGFVAEKLQTYSDMYERAVAKGTEEYQESFRISPQEIKDFLDAKNRTGELEINVTPRERSNVMEALGYRLRPDMNSQNNYWFPASE